MICRVLIIHREGEFFCGLPLYLKTERFQFVANTEKADPLKIIIGAAYVSVSGWGPNITLLNPLALTSRTVSTKPRRHVLMTCITFIFSISVVYGASKVINRPPLKGKLGIHSLSGKVIEVILHVSGHRINTLQNPSRKIKGCLITNNNMSRSGLYISIFV